MTYKLAFNESALKEWKKLGHTIQEQFKKKLRERLENPRVPASQLHGRKNQYKIKLRGAGYRLVYSVEDEIITVTVIGVGKRENDAVYKMTRHRSYSLRKCSLSRQAIRQTGSVLLCDGTLTYATYMKLWPTLCM